ncbi:MAG: class I SAM-dependent methyltransferase [Patescibacteria group bacterium]|nr:class I SAM-dependent methyltransferase [Patescibacteria group bacterium]
MRKNIESYVDKDKNIFYENIGFWGWLLRFPLVFLINILPGFLSRIIFTIFSKRDSDTQIVLNNPTKYPALETMYTFKGSDRSIADCFWQKFLRNAMAIRNRLKLTKKEISLIIKQVYLHKRNINIVSLGSGSARAVIEALAEIDLNLDVRANFIDLSRDAINFSKELASEKGITSLNLQWHRSRAENVSKICNGFQPDIVEMVGLLDYYPFDEAVELIRAIYETLPDGGHLITCNISPNIERAFVTKALRWPMIYREPKEIRDILVSAGFSIDRVNILYEPLGVHGLAIAIK